MDVGTMAFVLAAFFFSAFLKGITGMGFSTLCLPILTMVLELKTSLPLLLLPSISSNLLVMFQARHFGRVVHRFWKIYLATVPGLLVGLFLLTKADGAQARALLGAVILLYTFWAFSQRDWMLSEKAAAWLAVPVGFVTGLVNGMTGSQLIPILPYLLALGLKKAVFVQAINISFTLSSLVLLVGLGHYGLLESSILWLGLVGILPVALGIKLGGMLQNQVSDNLFRKLVLLFLFIIALALILRALLEGMPT